MRVLAQTATWIACNVLGVWLVATNLSALGNLGLALIGFLTLFLSWFWLAWKVASALRPVRKEAPSSLSS
jgi:nicotinamide riboside transporter PnuC